MWLARGHDNPESRRAKNAAANTVMGGRSSVYSYHSILLSQHSQDKVENRVSGKKSSRGKCMRPTGLYVLDAYVSLSLAPSRMFSRIIHKLVRLQTIMFFH